MEKGNNKHAVITSLQKIGHHLGTLGAPGLCQAMQVYFSWTTKHHLSTVLSRILHDTYASLLPTMIIFIDHFPPLDWSTIASTPVKCFSIQGHAIINFWRKASHWVWKIHYFFFKHWQTPRVVLSPKQECSWTYYTSEKEKSKYFLLLQHLTSWCFKALYNPVIFPMHLRGLQILCPSKIEKAECKDSVPAD